MTFRRIVGLTGGISSGTSSVSDMFESHGIPVVYADVVARAALKKGTRVWRKVVAAFGRQILSRIGDVDWQKLTVSSDPDRRRLLNGLLTPHIIKGVFRETAKLWMKGHRVVVLDAPMLFESGMDRQMDQTIVVWVDRDTQIRRLRAGGKISEQDAMNMINAEMPLDVKRNKANRVIDNSTGSQVYFEKQFGDIFNEFSRPLTWNQCLRSWLAALKFIALIIWAVLLCRESYVIMMIFSCLLLFYVLKCILMF